MALDEAGRVAEAQRLLVRLHPGADVPPPLGQAFADWDEAAWHVWNPGVRSWEVIERIARPVPELPLFVCGESYSWSQGWVEGALETATHVVAICNEHS